MPHEQIVDMTEQCIGGRTEHIVAVPVLQFRQVLEVPGPQVLEIAEVARFGPTARATDRRTHYGCTYSTIYEEDCRSIQKCASEAHF